MPILIYSPNGSLVGAKVTLEQARTALDVAGQQVVVTSALSQAQSDIAADWPIDRALKFTRGGSINNSNPFKIGGDFSAGKYRVFKGAGKITFGPIVARVYAEWWGAIADDTTDSTAGINAALVAHRVVQLLVGSYRVSSSLLITAVDGSNYTTQMGQCLFGAGSTVGGTVIKPLINPGVTRLKYMLQIGADSMMAYTYVRGVRIKGIHFYGSYTYENENSRLKDTQYSIMIRRAGDFKIWDCKFTDSDWGIYIFGRNQAQVITNFSGVIKDNIFNYLGTCGIKLMFGAAEMRITNNFMEFFGSAFYSSLNRCYGILSVGQTLSNTIRDNYIQYMGYVAFPSADDGTDGYMVQTGYGIGLYSGASSWIIDGNYFEKNFEDVYYGSNAELNATSYNGQPAKNFDYWDSIDLGAGVDIFATANVNNQVTGGFTGGAGACHVSHNAQAALNVASGNNIQNKIRTFYPLYAARVSYGGKVYYCKNDVASTSNPTADTTNWGDCTTNEPWLLAPAWPAWVSNKQYRSAKARAITVNGGVAATKPDWTGLIGKGGVWRQTVAPDVVINNTVNQNTYVLFPTDPAYKGGDYDSSPNPTQWGIGDYYLNDINTAGAVNAVDVNATDQISAAVGVNVNSISYFEGYGAALEQSVSFGSYFDRVASSYKYASANCWTAGIRHEPYNRRLYMFAGISNGTNAKGEAFSPINPFGIDYNDTANPYIVFNGIKLFAGGGSPETVITAPMGSLYMNRSGGAATTLYVKATGAGNTGWIAK
jgi:hypothetical protein